MDKTFTINMRKTGPMEFTTTFDKEFPELLFDEPSDSGGEDKYPNASRILTAAVANCLSASFTFCTAKSKIPVKTMETRTTCKIARNEEGYLRIKQLDVTMSPRWDTNATMEKKTRCVKIFKNYCVVSGSVSQGIPINVEVQLE